MGACLLSGFVWLAAAGVLLYRAAPLESGPAYDAALHSFFLGFVFTMIFGHAPVIFPAVLNLPISFRATFYAHLVDLHVALLLRVTGDLAAWPAVRQWGGVLSGVAIVLFLANTVASMIVPAKTPPQPARS